MTLKAFYEKTGADYDEVLRRMMNEQFVLKYLRKFPDDPHFAQLEQSLQEGDIETACRCAHTLKGLCLSLGLEQLGKHAAELNGELRTGDTANAPMHLAAMCPLYAEIISWIGEL